MVTSFLIFAVSELPVAGTESPKMDGWMDGFNID